MKSDKEFIDGIYKKVETIQKTCVKKQHIISKRIIIESFAVLSVACVFLTIVLFSGHENKLNNNDLQAQPVTFAMRSMQEYSDIIYGTVMESGVFNGNPDKAGLSYVVIALDDTQERVTLEFSEDFTVLKIGDHVCANIGTKAVEKQEYYIDDPEKNITIDN